MAYEQRDGQGSLFKNDRKEQENHPDYKGSLKIDAREYWVSGWKKSGSKGSFLSLAIQPKDKQAAKPAPSRQVVAPKVTAGSDLDEDIPF